MLLISYAQQMRPSPGLYFCFSFVAFVLHTVLLLLYAGSAQGVGVRSVRLKEKETETELSDAMTDSST